MVFVSFPIIFSVVRSIKPVSCVKRQKKNFSWLACSNQAMARSEWTCRFHASASQTLASRKFNVFIDLLVGQVYLGSLGNDERESYPLRPGALALQQDAPYPCQNQFTDRMARGSSLLFELAIERRGNIHCG